MENQNNAVPERPSREDYTCPDCGWFWSMSGMWQDENLRAQEVYNIKHQYCSNCKKSLTDYLKQELDKQITKTNILWQMLFENTEVQNVSIPARLEDIWDSVPQDITQKMQRVLGADISMWVTEESEIGKPGSFFRLYLRKSGVIEHIDFKEK